MTFTPKKTQRGWEVRGSGKPKKLPTGWVTPTTVFCECRYGEHAEMIAEALNRLDVKHG